MKTTNYQSGEVNPLLIPLILASVIAIGFAGFGGWAYLKYQEYSTNLQSKIDVAVSEGKKEQQKEDAKEFAEREKEPYETFVGPNDLGRVEFKYPKTWSVYVADDGDGRSYLAVLHPKVVHPLDSNKPYALRTEIRSDSYETVVNDYQSAVEDGDLRSQPVTVNGFNGIRLDGFFSEFVPNGQMFVFKVRDKTLTISSEAPQFHADFKNIILETIRFNP